MVRGEPARRTHPHACGGVYRPFLTRVAMPSSFPWRAQDRMQSPDVAPGEPDSYVRIPGPQLPGSVVGWADRIGSTRRGGVSVSVLVTGALGGR